MFLSRNSQLHLIQGYFWGVEVTREILPWLSSRCLCSSSHLRKTFEIIVTVDFLYKSFITFWGILPSCVSCLYQYSSQAQFENTCHSTYILPCNPGNWCLGLPDVLLPKVLGTSFFFFLSTCTLLVFPGGTHHTYPGCLCRACIKFGMGKGVHRATKHRTEPKKWYRKKDRSHFEEQ